MYISQYDKNRIWAYYLKRYTIRQISERTDIPVMTVQYHVAQIRKDRKATNDLALEFEAEYHRIRQSIEDQIKELHLELEANDDKLPVKLKLMDMIREREKDIWQLLGNGELVMWVRRLNERKELADSRAGQPEEEPREDRTSQSKF